MTQSQPVFTGGRRTPFAKSGKGSYAETRPDDLLCQLIKEQCHDNRAPEDLLVGCAYPEGEQGYNMARMVALGAGLKTPGVTINRLCASSLEVVAMAAARIKSGWGKRYLLGGVESMTRIPRGGASFSPSENIRENSPLAYISMGETAEEVATRYPISREQQEDFSSRSHEMADQAYKQGFYKEQIFPYLTEKDEFIRHPSDREKMASLKPAFKEGGVVTAATSSPLTDGATSGWVLEKSEAKEQGFNDGLEIIGASWSHVEPEVMGLGPVPAVQNLLSKHQLAVQDVMAWELNEAFAIQSLACIQDLKLPEHLVNSCGGALAIGHPLGASGLRLMMTLHHRLRHSGKKDGLGIATLCVGGGQGMAVLCKYIKL